MQSIWVLTCCFGTQVDEYYLRICSKLQTNQTKKTEVMQVNVLQTSIVGYISVVHARLHHLLLVFFFGAIICGIDEIPWYSPIQPSFTHRQIASKEETKSRNNCVLICLFAFSRVLRNLSPHNWAKGRGRGRGGHSCVVWQVSPAHWRVIAATRFAHILRQLWQFNLHSLWAFWRTMLPYEAMATMEAMDQSGEKGGGTCQATPARCFGIRLRCAALPWSV